MKIGTDNKVLCHECQNIAVHDGYCAGHWDFLFKGMTNHQRMLEKKKLREMRKERQHVQAG